MRTLRLALPAAVATLAAGTLAASLVTPAVAAPGDEVRLLFDGGAKRGGDPVASFANSGSAAISARVVRSDGGSLHRVDGRRSWAVRLPAFKRGSSPPRAVIQVRSDGARDRLEPGTSWFRFGAEFRLNRDSSGTSADNGDNLIQRGLWGDGSQFKVQVDGRRVMCAVKGTGGRTVVTSRTVVQPTHWYRAACIRDGARLSLRVRHFRAGSDTSTVAHSRGGTGALSFADRVPLSIGGKLRSDGRLARSTDQLNGVIDNAFLNIR